MSTEMKKELPWWQKYTLTLNEASEYFGIGYKKLKLFLSSSILKKTSSSGTATER